MCFKVLKHRLPILVVQLLDIDEYVGQDGYKSAPKVVGDVLHDGKAFEFLKVFLPKIWRNPVNLEDLLANIVCLLVLPRLCQLLKGPDD